MIRSAATALFVLGLLAGCGAEDPSPLHADSNLNAAGGLASGQAPALLRLWRDLPPVEHAARSPSQDPGQLWFEGRFDGSQLFYRVVEGREGVFALRAIRPQGGVLRVSASDGRALAMGGPVQGGEALRVSVQVQPVGGMAHGVSELPVLVLVELDAPFDPATPLSRDDVASLLDRRKHASQVLTALVGKERFELSTSFVTDPGTQALVVYLLSPYEDPSQSFVFEQFSIWQLPLAEHVALGGAVSRVEPLGTQAVPGAVRVELDRETRQALLAVPPARYVWDLPRAVGPRTLELALGVLPRDGQREGAVRFRVEADGATLLDETLSAPNDPGQPAWHDRMLDLPDDCSRLSLSTEPVGEDPPLAFLGHPSVRSTPAEAPINVVLISLDTLRPDRLGCYGAAGGWSPRLDALAAEGLRWQQAYSTSSYTLPSHASMLTGQYPAFHGAVDVVDVIDPEHSPLLATQLADRGWTTAAFTGGGYVSARYGFATGFDRYSDNDPVWALDAVRGQQLLKTMSWERMPIRAEVLQRYDGAAVERWIEQHGEGPPFFLFLHTYIAHNYAPDLAGLERAGLVGHEGDPDFQKPFNHKDRERFNQGEGALLDQVYEQYMPYYDATVGMADAFVGRVLDALGRAGVAERTLVVVTSDHGEEFGEHGFFGHGESLYEPVTRIPLIARLPGGGQAGRVLTDPVSLVDVAPWILRELGLAPDPRMAVTPPLGPDRGPPPERDTLVLELDNHRQRTSAVRDGNHKLVVELGVNGEDLPEERTRLFDLGTDPRESTDVSADEPALVTRLRSMLSSFHGLARVVQPRDGGPVDIESLDPRTLAELRALGYLGGTDGDDRDRR